MEPRGDDCVAKINQDCACIGHPFGDLRGTALFCVYDGHGMYGHDVAQEVMHFVFQARHHNPA